VLYLVVLLNEIEHILKTPTSVSLVSKSPQTAATASVQKAFTSAKVLDQLLVATKQYKEGIVEVNLGQQLLYLDNRSKKIFVSGSLVTSQLIAGKLACRSVDTVPTTALESRTFTDIFYELTISQSSADLANDLSANDEFAIKQWPNMVHSRHAKNMIRMAAYFSKQKATVNKAANDLAMELNHIIGFINAVHSQDLLVSYPAMVTVADTGLNHTESVQSKSSSGIGGLFGRIRQRLGI